MVPGAWFCDAVQYDTSMVEKSVTTTDAVGGDIRAA